MVKNSLRTPRVEREYAQWKKTAGRVDLRKELPIKDFKHFKIIEAAFPHNRIADTHHLLIPKRKFRDWKRMRWYERREFKKIDAYTSVEYDCIKLNYPSMITVPELVHWHLYILK